MEGWLSKDMAAGYAYDAMVRAGDHFKSCHVQGMGTGGRIKVTIFLKPLASRDIPEPDTYVFSRDDLTNGRTC